MDNKFVLVLWVPTGNQRPCKAPEHVTAKKDKKGCEKYMSLLRYGQYGQVGADGVRRDKNRDTKLEEKNGDKKAAIKSGDKKAAIKK